MTQMADLAATRARGTAVLAELFRALRPKDWMKNAFVLLAIFFAQDRLWLNPRALATAVAAFVLFCMVASAIYLMNDLVDLDHDRVHPKKRHRPLASGRLSPQVAVATAVLLLLVALPAGFVIDQNGQTVWQQIDFGLALVTYFLVQGVAYSFYLKHIVLLDVFTIAAGFVIRTVAGALVLSIPVTPWLLICMGLLALFLGLSKRRAELVLLQNGAGDHRPILQHYSLPMLDQMIAIIIGATIVAYTLFTTTAPTLPLKPFPLMITTVPFVIYSLFRYLYLMHQREGGGNAAESLLNDRPLAAGVLLWGLIAVALLANS